MASKNIAVYGIYASGPLVERAVDALKEAGFRNTDISVLLPEGGGTKDFAVEKETKTPKGAATEPEPERWPAACWGGWWVLAH